jgi:ketosteroid isomerase-like protein
MSGKIIRFPKATSTGGGMGRRILAFALAAVLALALFAGCSDSDEESVSNMVKDFYAAYNAEDWDACLDHIEDTNRIGEDRIESVLRAARAATGEVTVKSVEVEVSGASAAVYVDLDYSGDSQSGYPLVHKGRAYSAGWQTDGSWKIEWVWD